jgi:hypothetical protein
MKWNLIRSRFGLTIGTLAFVSLVADAIQLMDFLTKLLEPMTLSINAVAFIAFCIMMVIISTPNSISDTAAYVGMRQVPIESQKNLWIWFQPYSRQGGRKPSHPAFFSSDKNLINPQKFFQNKTI